MEFLPSFPRLHFAGKQVVASLNVGCFLKLKSMFIQSVLGVNRKYYGQRQNSESAILTFKLGRFCSELHYGAFLVQQNRSHFGFYHGAWAPASTKLRRTLGQTSSPKTKQKRKNTLYLSHKNPFNGLTITFNTMKVLTLVIFLSTCDYDCSLLSHFWVYTVFFQVFALAPPQAVLCRTEAGAKRSDEPQETMGRRKKKAVSFPSSFARIFSRRETCLETRQVFPRPVLGDFGHLLYFFSV